MPFRLSGECTARLPLPAHIKFYFNTQAFTVLPGAHLILSRERECVGEVPCLGVQRRSIIHPSSESNLRSLFVSDARYH